jgi:hypothetical protein
LIILREKDGRRQTTEDGGLTADDRGQRAEKDDGAAGPWPVKLIMHREALFCQMVIFIKVNQDKGYQVEPLPVQKVMVSI